MDKLSQILWRERELLDTLLYRLELEQLILDGGRHRWLMRAAREVEQVLEAIRQTEILRAVAADEVAATMGLPPGPSLCALADASAEPWRSLLTDHQHALDLVTAQIAAIADANRTLITAGYRSARRSLVELEGTAPRSGRGR